MDKCRRSSNPCPDPRPCCYGKRRDAFYCYNDDKANICPSQCRPYHSRFLYYDLKCRYQNQDLENDDYCTCASKKPKPNKCSKKELKQLLAMCKNSMPPQHDCPHSSGNRRNRACDCAQKQMQHSNHECVPWDMNNCMERVPQRNCSNNSHYKMDSNIIIQRRSRDEDTDSECECPQPRRKCRRSPVMLRMSSEDSCHHHSY